MIKSKNAPCVDRLSNFVIFFTKWRIRRAKTIGYVLSMCAQLRYMRLAQPGEVLILSVYFEPI